ncbi:MAG: hypothetical protein IKE14_14450 [Loktanella sp.]|nr:hypothetical protein [Loktanella sp.]
MQDELIATALIIVLRVIFHYAPAPKDLTVTGYDVASCKAEAVSGVQPIIVANKVYGVD